MGEKNVTRYLAYAFGEILLVVIGILIALQINDWSEKRKKKNQSDKAMVELLEEIRVAKESIKPRQSLNKEAVSVMKQYLENGYTNSTDSTKSWVVGYSFAYAPVDLSLPLLEREISSDHIILNQPQLIQKMRNLKSWQFLMDQERHYLDEYWSRNMVSFIKEQGLMLSFVSKAGEIDREVQGMEKLFDSKASQDLVAMEFFHVNSYTNRISKFEEIINDIDEELTRIIGENSRSNDQLP